MGLRVKPRHVVALGALLDAGTDGLPAVLAVQRFGLPLAELDAHGLAELYVDPTRVFTDRWRLTRAGDVFARFLSNWSDAA